MGEAVEEFGYESCPAGLVAGAEAAAGVAVEVFVEEEEVAPVGIIGVTILIAVAGALASGVGEE